ncbi:Antitoxin Phd_YefM, type II toxin-antitoxin system [Eubacterium ruminantium]|nr:Antitoxin Phd_YefM, type II toxin-antitoxin system [Eubacterium ruminantium]
MTQVNMFQAKTELSKLILSLENKENDRIIIARDGKPVAVLQLYTPEKKKVEIGKFDGKYHIPKDIDECNDEILALMEEG